MTSSFHEAENGRVAYEVTILSGGREGRFADLNLDTAFAGAKNVFQEAEPQAYEPPEAFKVEKIDMDDWMITCPHCKNGFIVHGDTWVRGVGEESGRSCRICVYCGTEALTVDLRPLWMRNQKK